MEELKIFAKMKVHQIYSISESIKRNIEKHDSKIFLFCGILYKFALDVLYIWVAHPLFGYAGLEYLPDFVKYIVTTILYIVLFVYLPRAETKVTSFWLHFQFMYTVAPMLTFCSLGNGSIKYMLMVCMCIVLEAYIVRNEKKEINGVYIVGIRNYVTVLLGVLLIVTLTIPIVYNGFAGTKAFDFKYIYEMREQATYPPGFSYVFFWMGKAIIPFAAIYCLEKKRYVWSVVCISIQVFLYMECGNKFLLFILMPAIVVYFLAKTGHLIKILYAGLSFLYFLLIPAYRMDAVGGHSMGVELSFYIAVRSIFHPADNKFAIYECFTEFPKMLFGNGLIGKMLGLTDLYRGSEGQIIYAYSGGTFLEANFNSGYLGEAYAQMGFLGMILMSVLFASIVKIVGMYDSDRTFCFLTAISSMYVIHIGDVSLLTTLFSSGLFVVILMFAIYLKKEKRTGNGI